MKTNDKSLLKYETIRDKFFGKDDKKLEEDYQRYQQQYNKEMTK